ncbi:hypothetical protein [Burkholderia pseudomallei]|uniref:hypothetical protein n=1 Tax=Burkholderia pseudomallei TaxID=28450 RepID=UPI000A1A2067|nr:hypothetical protein [Burkholderia pseudomallei]ARL36018.1 hypothetical protein BOC49_06900 [Burkholderia pseudomallei]
MSNLTADQLALRDQITALSAAVHAPGRSSMQLAADIMVFGASVQRAIDTDMPIADELLLALDDGLRQIALSGILMVLLSTLQQEGA